MTTAAARALHREEPPPWVLDDHLALGLAGEEGVSITRKLRDELSAEELLAFSRWLCVRARLAEDVVERAVAAGTRQYAILGAGLDSFAYRRPDLLERLRVFEVDHPASQAWKRERLAELGVELPANLVFAPIDFESQTLRAGLLAAGFDFTASAVFSWIGVTMYLTLAAIEATLETVAACTPESRIVLTYNLPPSALQGPGLAMQRRMSQLAGGMGEPWISFFTPTEAEALLRRCGFAEVEHFGPAEAIRTYFDGRSNVHMWVPQHLLVATTDLQRELGDTTGVGLGMETAGGRTVTGHAPTTRTGFRSGQQAGARPTPDSPLGQITAKTLTREVIPESSHKRRAPTPT